MAKHRTIDQALDMFEAWEAAALERRQRDGEQTLEESLKELEQRSGVRLVVTERAVRDSAKQHRGEIRLERAPRRKRRADSLRKPMPAR